MEAFIFALVDNIICMGMIFVLIKIFYAKFNNQGKILKKVSDSSYNMYLIHPFVVISISLAIASIPLSPLIKIAIVLPVAFILCYLISHFVLEKIKLKKHARVTQNI